MDIFGIIALALEKSLREFREADGSLSEDVVQSLAGHCKDLHGRYKGQCHSGQDFTDALRRVAYLYMHAGVKARLCEVALEESGLGLLALRKSRSTQGLRIACLGCGPGSELIGLVRHLVHREDVTGRLHLDCTLVDLCADWAETWSCVRDAVEAKGEKLGDPPDAPALELTAQFSQCNLANAPQLNTEGDYRRFDLHIASYLVSEDVDFGPYLRFLADNSRAGSRFMLIDRDEPRWRSAATRMLCDAGLDCEDPIPFTGIQVPWGQRGCRYLGPGAVSRSIYDVCPELSQEGWCPTRNCPIGVSGAAAKAGNKGGAFCVVGTKP